MPTPDLHGPGGLSHRRDLVAGAVLATLAALVAAGALITWGRSLASIQPLAQPLTVTACTVASYDPPAGRDPGPPQADCVRWFDGHRGATWPASEPIEVAGQVCNTSPAPVAYAVSVSFESVDSPALRVTVLDVSIVYDPGCNPPYLASFTFPEQATTAETLGRWRLIGRADPLDPSRYAPYQWDIAATVELTT